MLINEDMFYQIQYWIHEYSYILILIQTLLIALPFFFLKFNIRIKKLSWSLIITTFTTLIFLKFSNYVLTMSGWDRESICSWINIANSNENLNIYTAQMQMNTNTIQFSSYYHPVLLNKFEYFCNFSSRFFNFLIIGLLLGSIIFFIYYFKNVKSSSIIVLVLFSFNNLVWLLLTGQFFFLEFLTLILTLLFLKNGNYKFAIFFSFIFGIQKIYFFLVSIYLAIKYYKFKGLAALAVLFTVINLLSIELLPDFINFWFSSEGYFFGERVSRHSFLQERFGPNNQSLFFLIKGFTFLKDLISPFSLLIIVFAGSMILISIAYRKAKTQIDNNKILDFIVFLALILFYPLLKPYVFIYFSIILLFLIEEINFKKFEDFTVQITTFPAIMYLLINDYLYINNEELSYTHEFMYGMIYLYSFISSWILFAYVYRMQTIQKKNL